MKRSFIAFFFLLLLQSCGTYNSIRKGSFSDNKEFEIKTLAGCCGCSAVYYNIYTNKRIDEQLIYEFGCGFGEATRFKFHYDNSGSFTKITYLIGVFDSTFTSAVNLREKELLVSLDSLVDHNPLPLPHIKNLKLITGFREPKPEERIHPFAIGRKNKSIWPTRTNL
jgi:hypothetical protein